MTLEQITTEITVEFSDTAIANHFDLYVDAGIPPARFARIWCHTHPGSSADPSSTDEETFERVFSDCDWALMFILSRAGKTYARLTFNTGPGGSILLPTRVDWDDWPNFVIASPARITELAETWIKEFEQNIRPYDPCAIPSGGSPDTNPCTRQPANEWWDAFRGLTDVCDFDDVEPLDIVQKLEVAHDRFD